ncbi:hypothetical protein R1sor_014211 [Riccia sorocarpa]|uniref:Uncharacterized protein n=1 Tax=Riccia sorocarpa TaxID=122646 RepID=A0ABD3H8R6_9MARC
MARIAKLAFFDAFLSFWWVFLTSCLGAGAAVIAKALEYGGDRTGIVVGEVVVLIFVFSITGKLLGGASWNPTSPVAFYAAGHSKDSLFTLAIRLPAMAVGAAAGALTISEVMPEQFKHTLGGPKLKVDLHTGAVAEGVLTFLITLTVLWTVLRGPRNGILKTLIIIAATLFLVAKGGPYTGPAMNPSNAFGWAYVNQKHYSQEHLYVYWVTPFIGALGASAVYRYLFAPRAPKEKAA